MQQTNIAVSVSNRELSPSYLEFFNGYVKAFIVVQSDTSDDCFLVPTDM